MDSYHPLHGLTNAMIWETCHLATNLKNYSDEVLKQYWKKLNTEKKFALYALFTFRHNQASEYLQYLEGLTNYLNRRNISMED
jgi:hypothetical protein